MAGTNPAFDAGAFRTAIRAAMTMGLPPDAGERATFVWDTVSTYDKSDAGGKPFNWTSTPTSTETFPDVQIPVAVEFRAGNGVNTPVGQFDVSQAVLTVLDVDFELLTVDDVMANKVLLGGNTYTIEYVAPPLGLFEVGVFQIHVKAQDES